MATKSCVILVAIIHDEVDIKGNNMQQNSIKQILESSERWK